ncbi:unnamed protein product, partial [Gadus morhua 'NCC']
MLVKLSRMCSWHNHPEGERGQGPGVKGAWASAACVFVYACKSVICDHEQAWVCGVWGGTSATDPGHVVVFYCRRLGAFSASESTQIWNVVYNERDAPQVIGIGQGIEDAQRTTHNGSVGRGSDPSGCDWLRVCFILRFGSCDWLRVCFVLRFGSCDCLRVCFVLRFGSCDCQRVCFVLRFGSCDWLRVCYILRFGSSDWLRVRFVLRLGSCDWLRVRFILRFGSSDWLRVRFILRFGSSDWLRVRFILRFGSSDWLRVSFILMFGSSDWLRVRFILRFGSSYWLRRTKACVGAAMGGFCSLRAGINAARCGSGLP